MEWDHVWSGQCINGSPGCPVRAGKGSEIGDFLTQHPAVNCISFTGGDTGISVSKKVSASASVCSPCCLSWRLPSREGSSQWCMFITMMLQTAQVSQTYCPCHWVAHAIAGKSSCLASPTSVNKMPEAATSNHAGYIHICRPKHLLPSKLA